jgi:hypothetical protein
VEDVKMFMLEAENNFRDPVEIIEIFEQKKNDPFRDY